MLWSGNISDPVAGNAYLVMSRGWSGGSDWGLTETLSSGHHTVGDLAAALNPDGEGCLLFGAYDIAIPEYVLQAACLVPRP